MNADKNQYCSLSTVAQAVKPAEPRFISAFLRVASRTEQYCLKERRESTQGSCDSAPRRLLGNSSRVGHRSRPEVPHQRLAYLFPGLKRLVTLRGPAKSPRYLGFLGAPTRRRLESPDHQ